MESCIQTNRRMKERDPDNVVLSVRLRGADAVRFWKVMDTAKARCMTLSEPQSQRHNHRVLFRGPYGSAVAITVNDP